MTERRTESLSVWTPDQVIADAEQSPEWDEESLAQLKSLLEALGGNEVLVWTVPVQGGEKTDHE